MVKADKQGAVVENEPSTTTTWRQRRVARKLREWRTRAGMKQEETCSRLGWKSKNRLHRYETCKTIPEPTDVIGLAFAYGCIPDAERDRVVQLVLSTMSAEDKGLWDSYAPETVPDYFREYLETEVEASKVQNVEAVIVPGLLQTASYSDALMNAEMNNDELIAERRELRKQRQSRLDHEQGPLELHAVIHELALLARIGGIDTMRDQCAYLAERAAQPNVTVQVIPRDHGAHPGFGSSYHIVQFDHEADELVVYWENADSSVYLEGHDDAKPFTLKFERASSCALDPGASRELLVQYADGKFQ